MPEIYQVITAVGVPMVMAIIYSTLIYRRRALLKGETFSKAKFWGTLIVAGGLGFVNYLTNGLIIPTDTLLGLLEASTGAVVLAETVIKLIGAKAASSTGAMGLSNAVYQYLLGLTIPDNHGGSGSGTLLGTVVGVNDDGTVEVQIGTGKTVTSSTTSTSTTDQEYDPNLDMGLMVLPTVIEGASPLQVKLRILASPRWGPNAPTKYQVQWYDGSPNSEGEIVDGEAVVSHTYVYEKGAGAYYSKHFRPDVTVFDAKGKSENIPGLNEVSVDVFDAKAVAALTSGNS